MTATIEESLETLRRLQEQVKLAIILLESGCFIEDADATMPEPFHFRIGNFSIRYDK
jgi:hypothetical protein